jgi:ATP-dependent Lhr-like helicase
LCARQLLRRYGVVFRRVIERESGLPPWRDLLCQLRRLEARGEIRGGRFVAGFSGEQYALPEAVAQVRAIRRKEPGGHFVRVSGTDPLNLAGITTPGTKVAALATNRILYRDGVPIAARVAGDLVELHSSAAELRNEIRARLPE